MKDFQYYLNSIGEIGYVEETTSSIIYASGLPEVKPGELVLFETKDPSLPSQLGQVLSFNENSVELLFFSKDLPTPGTKIVRTNELLKIPLGDELLGNVIDPLGKSLEDYISLKKHPFECSHIRKRFTTNAYSLGILT